MRFVVPSLCIHSKKPEPEFVIKQLNNEPNKPKKDNEIHEHGINC